MDHDQDYQEMQMQPYIHPEYFTEMPLDSYIPEGIFMDMSQFENQNQFEEHAHHEIYHVPPEVLQEDPATMIGYISNTIEALMILEACLTGPLSGKIIHARLDKNQRMQVRSGSIFVFYEKTQDKSGIKRWTDGKNWSPSRIEGNFLIYSELETKMDRVNGVKRPRRGAAEPVFNFDPSLPPPPPVDPHAKVLAKGAFILSKYGLMKKSLSIILDPHVKMHVVCYFRYEDMDNEVLKDIVVSDLLLNQKFRKPIFEVDQPIATSQIVQTNYQTPPPAPARRAKKKKSSKRRREVEEEFEEELVEVLPKSRRSSRRSQELEPSYSLVQMPVIDDPDSIQNEPENLNPEERYAWSNSMQGEIKFNLKAEAKILLSLREKGLAEGAEEESEKCEVEE